LFVFRRDIDETGRNFFLLAIIDDRQTGFELFDILPQCFLQIPLESESSLYSLWLLKTPNVGESLEFLDSPP
jgi:hypothetical protein